MPKPHFEVVGIVRGRDLHGARPEFLVHIFVRDDWDPAIGQRKQERFPDQVRISRIGGIDRDGGIAEHRLGTGGRHDDELFRTLDGIFDVPKEPRVLGILHFRVRKRGLAAGAPVDDAAPLIDKPFMI